MRKFLLVLCLLAVVVPVACSKGPSPEEKARQQNQELVNSVVRNILYVEDSRTGIVFAYLWMGGGHGGPALAAVPRESVPRELIWKAEVKK
jgi:hypothetical protein